MKLIEKDKINFLQSFCDVVTTKLNLVSLESGDKLQIK